MSDLVGLNVQSPNFVQTMSGFMGLKQQQQQLEAGAATVQITQQDARQRAALAKINYNKWMGEDGTLDTNKMLADPQLASLGDAAPIAINQGIAMKAHQIENKKTLLGFNNDTLSSLGNVTQAVSQNPDVKAGNANGLQFAKDSLTKWATAQGTDVAKAVAPYMLPIMNNQVDPKQLSTGLQHISNMATDIVKQKDLTKSQPQSMTNPNGDMQLFEGNSLAPGGVGANIGAPKPQGVAPFSGVAPNSQPGVFTNGGRTFTPAGSNNAQHQKQSGFLNQDGSHRTAQQDAPPPTASGAIQENYTKAVTAANDHVQNVRDADEHYRTNVDISNKIRDLSRVTNTSPVMSYLQEKVGTTNIQELGAYLDRQAAGLQTAMNLPHTNQGQDMAKDISGNVKYSPTAIQEKNDFNQSLVEGFHAYRKGLERVGGLAGNGSPAAINQFKAAWAENFDPNVFRAMSAYSRKTEEGTAFVKSLSAQDAAKMLKDKKALELLSQGKLPE